MPPCNPDTRQADLAELRIEWTKWPSSLESKASKNRRISKNITSVTSVSLQVLLSSSQRPFQSLRCHPRPGCAVSSSGEESCKGNFALQKWWTKQILNILCIYMCVYACVRVICFIFKYTLYTVCIYIYTYILCKGSFAGGALVGRCQDELGRALYRIKEEQGVWLKTLILSSSTQRHLILCMCWHQIIAMLWHHPIPWSSQQISTLALQEDLIPNVSIWQTESFTNSPAWSLGNKLALSDTVTLHATP